VKKRSILLILALAFLQGLCAQETSKDSLKVSLGVYVAPYYNVDFNKPSTDTRPDFLRLQQKQRGQHQPWLYKSAT